MSMYTPHREVLDRPAGALQDESVGDHGWSQALRATDELKCGTVHLSLLGDDLENDVEPGSWALKAGSDRQECLYASAVSGTPRQPGSTVRKGQGKPGRGHAGSALWNGRGAGVADQG